MTDVYEDSKPTHRLLAIVFGFLYYLNFEQRVSGVIIHEV